MSLDELVSRIGQLEASAAFVISSHKGNPGKIQIIDDKGKHVYELQIESALLRRETAKEDRIRVKDTSGIFIDRACSTNTKSFATFLADILDLPLIEVVGVSQMKTDEASAIVAIHLHEENDRVHWTAFHTSDLNEIGPRVRISCIRRVPGE